MHRAPFRRLQGALNSSHQSVKLLVVVSGLSFRSALDLSLMMRGLRQLSISPTRQLAVLVEVNAAILSEYEAEKGESSFFLGI